MAKSRHILPIIVFAQFCGTSVWFASNAVMPILIDSFQLPVTAYGNLTSAIQIGFIAGTFIFALLTIADRFSPSKVFFVCALIASIFNYGITFEWNNYTTLLTFRFLTGVCLAGIYPVGMKIAADFFKEGLGKSLGFLVGALVLGTAFPHALAPFQSILPWKTLIGIISILAASGAFLVLLLVPNGPFRKQASQFKISAITAVFKPKALRVAAIGYFGHMWELYAFWAFLPLLILSYQEANPNFITNISFLSFLVIAAGSLGCILAGFLAHKYGTAKVAFSALFISCICCLSLPLIFYLGSSEMFLLLLFIWGITVVADSPLFSTLVAENAAPQLKGTALTIVNSIGFAITVVSILFINYLNILIPIQYLLVVLAIGPISGIINKIYSKKLL